MGKVIAIANQKGGVGKTTSAVNLAYNFSNLGYRTLLLDLDPQGNAGSGLGIERRPTGEDLYDVFLGNLPLQSIIVPSGREHLDIIPSSEDLVSIEVEIGKRAGREIILRSLLKNHRPSYDIVFIDCPPSSGLLTLNALGAADYLMIPLQAEYYALEGLSALLNTLHFVQTTFNAKLELLGVFLTMFDQRTNLASDVEEEVRSHFGERAFETIVPRSVRLSEAPSHGLSIQEYAPKSPGAIAYAKLAAETYRWIPALSGEAKRVANL